MAPFLPGTFGNPSGGHAAARAAKTALEEAREEIAELLGVRPAEVVFTAGGTEADNLAVKGVARRGPRHAGRGDGVVTTAFEHKGVLASCDRLAAEGFRIARRSPYRESGVVDLDRAASPPLDERTVVVSVMLVNNEVGTIQPLDEDRGRRPRPGAERRRAHRCGAGGSVARRRRAPRPASTSSRSRRTSSAGPKGTGALVVRDGDRARAADRRRRPGARAAVRHVERGRRGRDGRRARGPRATRAPPTSSASVRLRDRLVDGLTAAVPGVFENGDRRAKVAGNAHLGFRGRRGRDPARRARPGRRVRSGGLVVLVGRHRAVARARGDGRPPRRRAVVGPPEPRLRVDRRRRRRRARGDPRRRRATAPRRRGSASVSRRDRVLVAMSGGVDSSVAAALPARAGVRRHRRDPEAVGRRVRLRLLQRRRRRGRPARRRAARHPALRVQLHRRLRRRRRRSLRRRVRGRPHAESVCRVQPLDQVRPAPRARRRARVRRTSPPATTRA